MSKMTILESRIKKCYSTIIKEERDIEILYDYCRKFECFIILYKYNRILDNNVRELLIDAERRLISEFEDEAPLFFHEEDKEFKLTKKAKKMNYDSIQTEKEATRTR